MDRNEAPDVAVMAVIAVIAEDKEAVIRNLDGTEMVPGRFLDIGFLYRLVVEKKPALPDFDPVPFNADDPFNERDAVVAGGI